MLNENLSIANFYKLRKSDQGGFAKWRIGTLPKGMLLFKLTTMARRRRRYTASHRSLSLISYDMRIPEDEHARQRNGLAG